MGAHCFFRRGSWHQFFPNILQVHTNIHFCIIHLSFWQLWTVAIWLTQLMAKLVLEGQHLDRQSPTVVIQATTWWEALSAHVKPQECGLGVNLSVKVCCYRSLSTMCMHTQTMLCSRMYVSCKIITSHWIHWASNIRIFLLTVVDCGTLTDPANGQVSHTAGTTFGETATYSCDPGYNLVGDSNHTCRATGVWSGCAPTCQGMLLLEMEYYLTMSIMLVIRWSETGKKWLVHIVFTCANCTWSRKKRI